MRELTPTNLLSPPLVNNNGPIPILVETNEELSDKLLTKSKFAQLANVSITTLDRWMGLRDGRSQLIGYVKLVGGGVALPMSQLSVLPPKRKYIKKVKTINPLSRLSKSLGITNASRIEYLVDYYFRHKSSQPSPTLHLKLTPTQAQTIRELRAELGIDHDEVLVDHLLGGVE